MVASVLDCMVQMFQVIKTATLVKLLTRDVPDTSQCIEILYLAKGMKHSWLFIIFWWYSNSTQKVRHHPTTMTHTKVATDNQQVQLIHKTINVVWFDFKPTTW